MAEPSSGPYIVADQKTLSSVVLMDPKTQELVDQGADIPLDQILAGPYRSTLKFEDHPDGDVRGIGDMLRREGAPPEGPVTPHRGAATGRRKGWTGLSQGGTFCAPSVPVGRACLC